MCFSSEVSLITFLIGIVGAYLTISLNTKTDKIIGYFLGFVALMQIIEYFLWNHQVCDKFNKALSISGMILNHLQPIVLGFLVLYFNESNKNKNKIYFILFIYIIVIIPYSFYFIRPGNFDCTLKDKNINNHLIWNWNSMNMGEFVYTIFTISLASIAYFGFPTLRQGFFFSIVVIITFSTSLIIYPSKVIGSLWCFYTIFILFIYYILRKINIIRIKS